MRQHLNTILSFATLRSAADGSSSSDVSVMFEPIMGDYPINEDVGALQDSVDLDRKS